MSEEFLTTKVASIVDEYGQLDATILTTYLTMLRLELYRNASSIAWNLGISETDENFMELICTLTAYSNEKLLQLEMMESQYDFLAKQTGLIS